MITHNICFFGEIQCKKKINTFGLKKSIILRATRQAWVNIVHPDKNAVSKQGLCCLQHFQLLLSTSTDNKMALLKF